MALLNESVDDVDEPKLTYERILNDLSDITRTDTITSSCLHSKLFAIGTLYGRIHVFDHQGNKVNRHELCFHLKSVDSISIDERGEYLASCSSDRLVVYGLCDGKPYFNMMPDKPLNVVAIDPYFHKPDGGRRFVAGDDRVVLYERGLLTRYKSTVLPSKEQKVKSISWYGQFIAWASDKYVQIFDVEQKAVITRFKKDSDIDYAGDYTCQFSWKDKKTLLIGWSNTVRVCLIKERSREMMNEAQLRELPKKYVEIISMFETDFTILGLAPFNDNLFTLSIHNQIPRMRRFSQGTQSSCNSSLTSAQSSNLSLENSSINTTSNLTDTDQSDVSNNVDNLIRPQIHVLETFPNTYNELSKDILTPNGCLTVYNKNVKKATSYSLMSLHSEGLYFIVCPKDIISAKPRDYDDHIDWLIQHSMLKECHQFAKDFSSELLRHSVREVEELYMNDLMEKGTTEHFKEAALLCSSICGSDQESWEVAIKRFSEAHQLKHLLPYLPKKLDQFHLNKTSYNSVLNEFLKNDSVSFFKAIKEIPCQLYSLQSMTDQVIQNLADDPKNLVLNEALAELYTRSGNFEDAVNIYLDYNDKTRIFSLIRNNNLVSILRDRVDRLMQIDADETSKLLVENLDSIPMKGIVERLESYKSKRYLLSYLHRLVLKDPDSCIEYQDLMVNLYAQYQPESLLNFLKISTNYRLEEALQICKDSNLIKEVVFLLGRMGDLRIALKYITESQGINEAIEFCKEHQDSDLWQDLIVYSMDKPEFIGALLKNIGTHINDPIDLIDRIPNGCEIEGLMPALVKILQDYQLQISLEQSCRDLMAKDCFSLLEKQIACQTQGIAIKEDQVCDHCNQPLFNESMVDSLSQSRGMSVSDNSSVGTSSAASIRVQPSHGPSMLNDLVVFGCHHVFHEECCANTISTAAAIESDMELTNKLLNCRVCMLEKDDDSIAPS